MAENTSIAQLILNDSITFNTYGVNTVNNVANGTLLAITTGTALRDPVAAAANHANIYSSLPNTPSNPVPNDYTKYNYLVIRLVDNTIVEIGIPWINPTSLTRLVRKTATVVLTDVDTSTTDAIVNLLTNNGYTVSSLTTS